MLSLFDKYEMYWYILQNSQEMIRFSELKAGFVISIYGIIFSVLFNKIDQVRGFVDGTFILVIIAAIFLLLVLISFYYSFRCFVPRFENKNPTSIIYFGDIVSDFPDYHSYHKYLTNIIENEEEMSIQLAEQIHTISGIATKKMMAVSKSIRYMLWSMLILMALVIARVIFL